MAPRRLSRGIWGASNRTWRDARKVHPQMLTPMPIPNYMPLLLIPQPRICPLPQGPPNLTSSRRSSLITLPHPTTLHRSPCAFFLSRTPRHHFCQPAYAVFVHYRRPSPSSTVTRLGYFSPSLLGGLSPCCEAFPVSLGLIVFFSFPLILLGKALGSWGPHHYCSLFLLTDELSHVIQPLPWFLQHDNGEETYLTELRGLKRQYTWKWSLAEPWVNE